MINQKLRLKEKIGYGFGDGASSMFWKVLTVYLPYFYTDIFGISASIMATMFLITKLWDVINDPIMGVISDRTTSRFGKFRPYLLWVAIPFGIIGVLTFITPDYDMKGKIIYAYITYTLMMMVYTAINVPYASLLGVMTSNEKERTTLASFRMSFAFGGSILALALVNPLVNYFMGKNITIDQQSNAKIAIAKIDSVTRNTIHWVDSLSGKKNSITGTSMVESRNKNSTNTGQAASALFAQIDARALTSKRSLNKIVSSSIATIDSFGKGSVTVPRIRSLCSVADTSLTNFITASKIAISDGKMSSLAISKNSSLQMLHSKVDEFNNYLDKKAQYAWKLTMAVFAIIAVIFFFLTFSWTRERVKSIQEKQSHLKVDLLDLLKNKPWWILLGSGVATLIFNTIRDGAAIYYFKYYIGDQSKVSIYLVLGQIFNIVGIIFVTPLANKFGKKRVYLLAMVFATFLSIFFYWINKEDFILILVFQSAISICAGSIFPLLWAMYADIVDYSEWKTGRRATGLIFSSSSMSQKLGWTLGGTLSAWLLAYYGFKANVVQSVDAQHAIRMMLSIFPAIGTVLSVLFIAIYPLSEHKMESISAELADQREKK